MNLDILQWKLLAAACLLLSFGTVILWYQSQAKSCTRHSHVVGRIAVVLACCVMAIGLGILMYVLSL